MKERYDLEIFYDDKSQQDFSLMAENGQAAYDESVDLLQRMRRVTGGRKVARAQVVRLMATGVRAIPIDLEETEPKEKLNWKILVYFLVMLFLFLGLLFTRCAHAADSDNEEVHALAHFGAGAIVADLTAVALHPYKSDFPWLCGFTEVLTPLVATVVYEGWTNKSWPVAQQHDFAGALGGLGVAITANW